MGNLVNFALFQAVWFLAVLGAADGRPWLGALAAALLLPLNLAFVPAGRRGRDVRMWCAVGVLGLALDSALLGAGLVGFPDVARPAGPSAVWDHVVPPWIVALWVAVGTLLRASLGWLRGRPWVTAACGAVGGPLSFWSGVRLGATEMPAGWLSVLALSVEYAVLFPILLAATGDRRSDSAIPGPPP